MFDLESEYNNRSRVPGHAEITAGWERDAAAFRSAAAHEADVAYGPLPRMRMDIFPAGQSGGPVLLFIHGGYWRSLDKSRFSHMAAGPLAHGVNVAVASYSLCPEVKISAIIAELRQAAIVLKERFGHPLAVAGHSAGGHLAACLYATDWEAMGQPEGLVSAGLGISGLYDLRPLMATSVNDSLRMEAVEAVMASPLLWPLPQIPHRGAFALAVGGDESHEYLRQSNSLAAAWQGLGIAAPCAALAGENHFSIIGGLARPDSALTGMLLRAISPR